VRTWFGRKSDNKKLTLLVIFTGVVSSSARRAFSGNMGSVDGLFESEKIDKSPGDANRRDFTYFMLGGGRLVWATTARIALLSVRIVLSKN
jgi:hypothetical protein